MRRLPLLTLVCTLAWAGLAVGRTTERTGYSKSQTINCAIRYLRVDSELTITERDLELGYLLFEYPTGSGQTTPGSIEVVERDEGAYVIVQLPKLPQYHESRLIRGLVSKLRSDYGPPRKVQQKAPPRGKKDADPPTEDQEKDKADGDEPTPPDGPIQRYRIK